MSKMTDKDDIVLGSGDLFVVDSADSNLASLEIGSKAFYDALEVDANQIGHISGGCSLEYKATWTRVKDDYKVTVKQFITDEDVTLKSGVLAWNGDVLEMLCATARKVEQDADGITLYKFGGIENSNGKTYFIHFRHRRDDNTYIRVTIIGLCESGFTLAFDPEKETIIDATFSAQGNTNDKGTLVYYSEQVAVTKVATPVATPSAGEVASGTDVVLTCATSAATIYYTTDGEVPTTASTPYTGTAIAISTGTTIKAIAVKTGLANSDVLTATYTIS